jgi:hypothetical protein
MGENPHPLKATKGAPPAKAGRTRKGTRTMRVYKFLNEQFGLKSISEGRLKHSRLHDLNDPFELVCCDVTDPYIRQSIYKTQYDLGVNHGMLCFSEAWNDPVIWAYYSDKHAGLCLGIELLGDTANPTDTLWKRVNYVNDLLPFPDNFLRAPMAERSAFVEKLLYTKYQKWDYEKEIRTYGMLQNKDGNHYYVNFGEPIRLAEIIVGAKCPVSRRALERATRAARERSENY